MELVRRDRRGERVRGEAGRRHHRRIGVLQSDTALRAEAAALSPNHTGPSRHQAREGLPRVPHDGPLHPGLHALPRLVHGPPPHGHVPLWGLPDGERDVPSLRQGQGDVDPGGQAAPRVLRVDAPDALHHVHGRDRRRKLDRDHEPPERGALAPDLRLHALRVLHPVRADQHHHGHLRGGGHPVRPERPRGGHRGGHEQPGVRRPAAHADLPGRRHRQLRHGERTGAGGALAGREGRGTLHPPGPGHRRGERPLPAGRRGLLRDGEHRGVRDRVHAAEGRRASHRPGDPDDGEQEAVSNVRQIRSEDRGGVRHQGQRARAGREGSHLDGLLEEEAASESEQRTEAGPAEG
mmetsp:Transcript_41976/g.91560  ORF Transcript_41976/g.91560 Transcript_41976/m.91560 type:complete len:350 (-) Transcript_41976:108-1157(-)